ncbi:ABC-three component system protein [Photobacterium leiognathi]|uniref:ABC-three component system protein n=1 Tax=Photobacterium leiognathi TaxID=553611 RepID=UPI002980E9B2|nr:ABC-three component system protein [Photobacterium leiognathi]
MNSQTVNYNDSDHYGDNVFTSLSSLEQAVEEIKRALGGNCDAVEIIENLADYIAEFPDRNIIGLEEKLVNGGRSELYSRALILKNRFERKIAKNQMSLVEQHIYVQILSTITSIWYSKIKPLIDMNEPKKIVDKVIYDELIEPVHKAVVRYDILATSELVSGMLYYLTGKCHLVWD